MTTKNGFPKILVIDDDPIDRKNLRAPFEKKYPIVEATNAKEAKVKLAAEKFRIVILDLRLPDGDGLELIEQIRALESEPSVIAVSGIQDVRKVAQAMKLGAVDFIPKPIDHALLEATVEKIIRQEKSKSQREVLLRKVKTQAEEPLEWIGSTPAIRQICNVISSLKKTESTILLTGESGVGKEVIARMVHRQEGDLYRPFVPVNCAAIPSQLMESTLFGHEKGAFTGATQKQMGKFVLAHGGDIFLDEISCLTLELQAKLLRVLQEKEVEPVGASRALSCQFRVIAATNRDLVKMVSEKGFREDLYFRLKVIEIYLPPLRSHKEDIPELVEYFLRQFGNRFGTKSVDPKVLKTFAKYDWPGNVRELKNTLENMAVLARKETLTLENVPHHILHSKRKGNRLSAEVLRTQLETKEKDLILRALEHHNWSKSRASKELGISRSILYRKIQSLRIHK